MGKTYGCENALPISNGLYLTLCGFPEECVVGPGLYCFLQGGNESCRDTETPHISLEQPIIQSRQVWSGNEKEIRALVCAPTATQTQQVCGAKGRKARTQAFRQKDPKHTKD